MSLALQVWKAEADNICGYDGTVLVAVKTTKENAGQSDKDDFLKEAKAMAKIRHSHIVSMIGLCLDQDHNKYFLVLELMEGGDLLSYLR